MSEMSKLARHAIGSILDGATPNGTDPAELGTFRECYEEMASAHTQGGTSAARAVFAAYAKHHPELMELRSGSPIASKALWNTYDLLHTEFPPQKWTVPDLIPVGLTILAGRPKLGKSWLALQVAIAVGTGGTVLGKSVDRNRVLYLALEDGERRLQRRLRQLGAPDTALIDFRLEWPSLAKNAQVLTEAIEKHDYGLVVVDTLSRAFGGADQNHQGEMTLAMGTVQRIAIENNITILLIDHQPKTAHSAQDVIDNVMGATAKAAVADTVIGLYRTRSEKTADLKASGRDIDDVELPIAFDIAHCGWQLIRGIPNIRKGSVQDEIVAVLQGGDGATTAPELAAILGKQTNNMTRDLRDLEEKGIVRRGSRKGAQVQYVLAEELRISLSENDE